MRISVVGAGRIPSASLRVGPVLFALLSLATPAYTQEAPFERGLVWIVESGLVLKSGGNRYPGDLAFIAAEIGAKWQYHPSAGIGAVARKAVSLRREVDNCSAVGLGCVIEQSNLPAVAELRFSRSLGTAVDLNLGLGTILDSSGGFASHLSLEIWDAAAFSLHGDLYEDEWHWLVGAGLTGRTGLAALAVALAFRMFVSFGET